jgi:putative lipase involved disintegration of autophagic bodies
MKNLILTAFSMCLITISSHAYSMDMSGNSSQMMGMQMNMTENDVYSHLSGQDRAIYDKLDAQQRAFVVRMINGAPQMQMMHQKMMKGQDQMQQDRGMNRGTMQQDQGMMQQDRNMYNQR